MGAEIPKELKWLFAGLQRIKGYFGENFSFIFENKVIKCNVIYAEFLSPKVHSLRSKDSSVYEFKIETEDKYGLFEVILALLYGDLERAESLGHIIKESEIQNSSQIERALCNIATELGNSELYEALTESELSVNNCVSRLKMRLYFKNDYEEELEFICRHFYEISEEELIELDHTTLSNILMNENLVLTSEDSLMAFVIKCVEHDSKNCCLFDYIKFEYLSRESVVKFYEFEMGHRGLLNYEQIFCQLKRLYCEGNLLSPSSPQRFVCEYRSDGFEGIINYLSEKWKRSVFDGCSHLRCFKCESSSCLSGHDQANIAHFAEKSIFHSENHPNEWIRYEFPHIRIKPTHYTLHVRAGLKNRLKSWVIEVSNTGDNDWIPIDEQDNNDLNEGEWETYEIKCKPDTYYRFIRLRQTGPNHLGANHLVLSSWEIFGQVIFE